VRAQGRALSRRPWRDPAALLRHPHVGQEVFGVTEAGAWNPLVLLVVQRHAFADAGVELGGDRWLAHREGELLGDGALALDVLSNKMEHWIANESKVKS